MPTDAKSAQTKVKPLQSKLPATGKVPQYLQAKYKAFAGQAQTFINDLDALVKSVDGAVKDRTDYAKNKKALEELKKKVDGAVKEQKDEVSTLLKEIGPINKSASELLDILKDKKAKEETDLSSAVFKFSTALQSISSLEAPSAVD